MIASEDCDETDDELAARFERDVIPLLDNLFAGAMRMTLHRADAEDLVQETMVKAYAGFRSFQHGTNLIGWLFRIQADAHISSCCKRMRRPTETISGTVHDWQLAANAEHSARALRSAEVEVLESLPDTDIRNALDALPEELRMAVYYADVEGLAYKEIRDIMGTPLGTVVSRIQRGRSQLRMLLADLAATAGTSPVSHSRRPTSVGT